MCRTHRAAALGVISSAAHPPASSRPAVCFAQPVDRPGLVPTCCAARGPMCFHAAGGMDGGGGRPAGALAGPRGQQMERGAQAAAHHLAGREADAQPESSTPACRLLPFTRGSQFARGGGLGLAPAALCGKNARPVHAWGPKPPLLIPCTGPPCVREPPLPATLPAGGQAHPRQDGPAVRAALAPPRQPKHLAREVDCRGKAGADVLSRAAAHHSVFGLAPGLRHTPCSPSAHGANTRLAPALEQQGSDWEAVATPRHRPTWLVPAAGGCQAGGAGGAARQQLGGDLTTPARTHGWGTPLLAQQPARQACDCLLHAKHTSSIRRPTTSQALQRACGAPCRHDRTSPRA